MMILCKKSYRAERLVKGISKGYSSYHAEHGHALTHFLVNLNEKNLVVLAYQASALILIKPAFACICTSSSK